MRYYDDTLEHSWGKSPKQKAREREYNQDVAKKKVDGFLSKFSK